MIFCNCQIIHAMNINIQLIFGKVMNFIIVLIFKMFIAEALADFSKQTMKGTQERQEQDKQAKHQQKQAQKQDGDEEQGNDQQQEKQSQQLKSKKRQRPVEHNTQLNNEETQKNKKKKQNQVEKEDQEAQQQITYTSFKTGDKILVKQTYQNGWWFGHPISKPELIGFFPSNYVKVGAKPPPPPPSKKVAQKGQQQEAPEYDPNQGTDWIKSELDQIKTGPVKSDYYQGIKGYKMVKIDEKNQNILKGNHVQFDVATGLARVPVKDQAPAAKAVRQMGYYFDYHQWNQTRNQNPNQKARPDPKKKKAKKLHLKMMD